MLRPLYFYDACHLAMFTLNILYHTMVYHVTCIVHYRREPDGSLLTCLETQMKTGVFIVGAWGKVLS